MAALYWWLRFGNFSPGEGLLPHVGEVITYYRKKRYKTQADFAVAAGVFLRSVQEWETAIMTHDHERRIFLAKMLKIPPALLGLDWRLVLFENNTGDYKDPLPHLGELAEEDAYYAYEDILVMGHEYIHNGGSLDIASRIDRRLKKLVQIVKNARSTDEEAWKTLLCRYYQLSTRMKQQCTMESEQASRHAQYAIYLANELQDAELLGAAFVHSACTNHQQGRLEAARQDIASAMETVDRIRNGPLKGNIYLESANINTLFASSDSTLQEQCRQWQEKAATLLYKGPIEPDETFFKFNLSAVNHEKAKSLLHWQRTKNDRKTIRSKLTIAIETLDPNLNVWRAYYSLTEARLFLAEHDLEGSAQAAKAALQTARTMHSKIEEQNVKNFYEELRTKALNNPYIDNLGVELGVF